MSAKNQPKVLRIGIIEDGKIVQERLIKAGDTVTVGESAKNTFPFPKTHLPRAEYPLFVARNGKYVLNFTDQMKGKISSGGAVVPLEKLRADPQVQQQGGSWRLPLTEQDRGKITIDNITVLFQFVAPPPPQAVKPLQQMDFRPKLMDDDDPVFLGFLAIFSALAAVLMVWIWNTEPAQVTSIEQIPDRFTKLILKPPEEPPPPLETPKDDKLVDESKEEKAEKAEAKEEKPKEAPKDKVEAAQQREALKQDVMQKSLLLKMLTTKSDNSRGFAEDLWSDGEGPTADLDAALAASGNVEIASAENKLRQGQGGPGNRDADIGDLQGTGVAGDAKVGSAPVAKLEGSTQLGDGDAILEEGDAGAVKKTVQKNFAQLTYCYEQRLNKVPGLQGRVEIEWYVKGGRVTSANVFANTTGDAELGTCIVGKVKRWSFPAEIEGEILYPFIFKPKG